MLYRIQFEADSRRDRVCTGLGNTYMNIVRSKEGETAEILD